MFIGSLDSAYVFNLIHKLRTLRQTCLNSSCMRSNIEPQRFHFRFQLGELSSTFQRHTVGAHEASTTPASIRTVTSNSDDVTSLTVDSTRVTRLPRPRSHGCTSPPHSDISSDTSHVTSGRVDDWTSSTRASTLTSTQITPKYDV